MPVIALTRATAVGLALAGVFAVSACTAVDPATPTPIASDTGSNAVADGEDLTPDTSFTPLVVTPTTTPAPVLATDGRVHYAYELLLTNAAPVSYEMAAFEVVDPESGRRS